MFTAPASPARSCRTRRLMGSAPQARILGIRAFGTAANGAESTTFVILKALNYAVLHGAQIVNMSFAGPKDPLIERGIGAMAARGIVMVAAAGNAGAKSPPLYPAANSNVIAVSATDAGDKLFAASNRGGHIAIAAPGVDIFLPAPDGKYQMTSGTSFSAAYISGLAALMLERNPALKPGRTARNPDGNCPRSGQPRSRRSIRRRRSRCVCCGLGHRRRAGGAGRGGSGHSCRRNCRGPATGSPDTGPEPAGGGDGVG